MIGVFGLPVICPTMVCVPLIVTVPAALVLTPEQSVAMARGVEPSSSTQPSMETVIVPSPPTGPSKVAAEVADPLAKPQAVSCETREMAVPRFRALRRATPIATLSGASFSSWQPAVAAAARPRKDSVIRGSCTYP